MPPRPLQPPVSASGDDPPPSEAADRTAGTASGSLSRRRFLAGASAAVSAGVAGCTARLPGRAGSVASSTERDGDTLVWNYPASAVRASGNDEGIGYAAIRFRALDAATDATSVTPVLEFRLNSTVGATAAGASSRGYQADWFRFHVGVPRSYDGLAGLRTFVQPPQWPEVRTTYGYDGAVRELVVEAPSVNEEGTIVVDGQFRPPGRTLPRQLHCRFEVQASQPGPFGRTVLADGRATFDVSGLDLPPEVTVGQ